MNLVNEEYDLDNPTARYRPISTVKVTDKKPTHRRWVLLVVLCSLFILGWNLKSSILKMKERQLLEIEKYQRIEELIEKASQTIPHSRAIYEELLVEIDVHLVPQNDQVLWCYKMIEQVDRGLELNLDYTVKGRQVPRNLNVAWPVYEASHYIPPSIIPFCVDLNFTGRVEDIFSFFERLEQMHPSSMVSYVELNPGESLDLYEGAATIVFPCFQYPEVLTAIDVLDD